MLGYSRAALWSARRMISSVVEFAASTLFRSRLASTGL
jgi:hypothetical protein